MLCLKWKFINSGNLIYLLNKVSVFQDRFAHRCFIFKSDFKEEEYRIRGGKGRERREGTARIRKKKGELEEKITIINSLNNLQPLWAVDNLRKSNKILN